MKTETKKINANIPAGLKKRLELFCVKNEIYIKDVLSEALQQYLDKKE